MNHFRLIKSGIDVYPVREQLAAHSELWDADVGRKGDGSPHMGAPDIWVRFRSREELSEVRNYAEPHFAVFYPAWEVLPALKPIVFGIMAQVQATYLGGILITKIPPGGRILPHHDRGSWHAEYHNCKVYVPLQANEQCVNRCEDESVVMKEGEAWEFNNLLTHSVENNGEADRITLILCFRVEG